MQLIREVDITKDKVLVSNISKIRIKFSSMNEEVPFFLAKGDLVNCKYKNRIELYLQVYYN